MKFRTLMIELEEVILDLDRLGRKVGIGVGLPEEVRKTVIQVLKDFKEIFA